MVGDETPVWFTYMTTRSYGRPYSSICFNSCSHTWGNRDEAKEVLKGEPRETRSDQQRPVFGDFLGRPLSLNIFWDGPFLDKNSIF